MVGKKKKAARITQKQISTALVPVVEFLNEGKSRWLLHARSLSVDEIEALRTELISDLLPIAEPTTYGYEKFKRSEKVAAVKRMTDHLDFLCEKINDLGELRPVFESGLVKQNLSKRLQGRAQGIFAWGAGEWLVDLNFTVQEHASERYELYGRVAAGLVSGELARLRRCGYCRRFFIAPQARMTFCPGTDHARLYYDRPSQRPADETRA